MSAPCNIFVLLPVHYWISFVDMIIPKGLEGLDFLHLQSLVVQSINVIDGEYLKYESDLPEERCYLHLHQYLPLMQGSPSHIC